jgi:hypothetical protein
MSPGTSYEKNGRFALLSSTVNANWILTPVPIRD